MKRSKPLNRTTTLKKGRGFAASPAQRQKVKGENECFYYPFDLGCMGPIQPAHLTARSKGGCDDAACVIGLCAFHHRQFDDGKLDLLRAFADRAQRLEYLPELQHMLVHLSPVEMVEQLANARVEWRETKEAA